MVLLVELPAHHGLADHCSRLCCLLVCGLFGALFEDLLKLFWRLRFRKLHKQSNERTQLSSALFAAHLLGELLLPLDLFIAVAEVLLFGAVQLDHPMQVGML